MAATIPTLWPDDIKVDVLPPVVILKYQATKIRELTNGIIQADVTTTTGHEDFVVHRLELIAPLLDNRRYGVLSATHRTDIYPVQLEADVYRPKTRRLFPDFAGLTQPLTWPPADDWRPVASDQDEFIKRVSEVLRSREVRSVIDSMIALSNQRSLPHDSGNGSGNGAPDSPEPK